jgi:hypothetical protein
MAEKKERPKTAAKKPAAKKARRPRSPSRRPEGAPPASGPRRQHREDPCRSR